MKRHVPPILFIIAVSLAIYANSLKNGFVYDDEFTVTNNSLIKSLDNLPMLVKSGYFQSAGEGSYRPVVTLTYFLDYALYGLNPWGFHLTNILLHTVNGALLYIFITQLIKKSGIEGPSTLSPQPLIVSLLFITHPVLTEAVNAVSFREDLLAFLFYFSTLILCLKLNSNPPTNTRVAFATYILSCLLYFAALLSKEMAVTLPLIIYLYDLFFNDKKSLSPRPYNLGYLAVTCIYLYIRFYHFYNPVEYDVVDWGIVERLFTTPRLLLYYLKLTLFPFSLSADYVIKPVSSFFSLSLIGPLSVIILILAAGFLSLNRNKMAAFGLLFFFITLIPVYNIIPVGNPFAERYLYLPISGLILAAVFTGCAMLEMLTQRYRFNKAFGVASFLIAAGVFSVGVMNRNIVWNNDYSLWIDTLRKMPDSCRSHNNLGLAYYELGMFTDAAKQFQDAIKLKPENSQFHKNLGSVSLLNGNTDLAIQELQAALKLNPSYPEARHTLGSAYAYQGRFEEAIEEYQTAIKLKPDYAKAHYTLGQIYMKTGLIDEGRLEVKEALRLNPDLLNK